ncbi:hypothetical protein K470DRAFT_256050 [Piedraia hortae CBS 480.64]|uniref:RING-type domain-containing protein n=1 Tax=Piedraia hortae CBS 480.64 TaxID=1314780 RepID=A0A6A7C4H5_9PEZI|nr:hypothetical protein K470DRAFT_256050 [Piedraia hortae CBS 480.64]
MAMSDWTAEELELASSLPQDELPAKLCCGNCNRLALDAVKLPCCDTSLCLACSKDLSETCPVCSHSPVDVNDLIPNKNVRQTVKVWLKSALKKRAQEQAADAADAEKEAELVVDSIEKPEETESEPTAPPRSPSPDKEQSEAENGGQAEANEEEGGGEEEEENDDDDDDDDDDDVVITTERPESVQEYDATYQQSAEQMQPDMSQNGFGYGQQMGIGFPMNGFNAMMGMGMGGFGGMPMMGMPGMDPAAMMNMMGGMNMELMGQMMGGMPMMGGFGGMGPNMGMGFNAPNGFNPNYGNPNFGPNFSRGYGRGRGFRGRGGFGFRGRGGYPYGQNRQPYTNLAQQLAQENEGERVTSEAKAVDGEAEAVHEERAVTGEAQGEIQGEAQGQDVQKTVNGNDETRIEAKTRQSVNASGSVVVVGGDDVDIGYHDQSYQHDQGYLSRGYRGRGGFRGGRGGHFTPGGITEATELGPAPTPPANAPSGPRAMREGKPNSGIYSRPQAAYATSERRDKSRSPEGYRGRSTAGHYRRRESAADHRGREAAADYRGRDASPDYRDRSADYRERPRDDRDWGYKASGYESDETYYRRKDEERRRRRHREDDERRQRSRDRSSGSSRRHRHREDNGPSHHHRERSKDRGRRSRRHRRSRSRSLEKEREVSLDVIDTRRKKVSRHEEDRKRGRREDESDKSRRRWSRDRAGTKPSGPIKDDELGFKIKGLRSSLNGKAPPSRGEDRDRKSPDELDAYAKERKEMMNARIAKEQERQRRASQPTSSLSKRASDQDPRPPRGSEKRRRKVNVRYEDELVR